MSAADSFLGRSSSGGWPGSLTVHDRRRLIGRGEEIAQLCSVWQRHRLTVLCGASGSGKTSLVRAGAVPWLRSRRADVLPVASVSMGPSEEAGYPVAGLPPQNPFTRTLLEAWRPREPLTRLTGLSIADHLRRRVHVRDVAATRGPAAGPVLVAIDQAERLFRDPDSRRTRGFVDELHRALEAVPHLRLLLVVRETRLDDLTRLFKTFDAGPMGWLAIPSVGREEARRALTDPLEGSRPPFTDAAADQLLDELSQREGPAGEGIEPVLLQLLCRPMWDRRPGGAREITPRDLPDVDEVLTDFCRAAISDVAVDHDLPSPVVAAWLSRIGHPDAHDHLDTRDGAIPFEVLDALEERFLLTTRRHGGVWRHEARHPLLVRAIDRVRREDRPERESDAATRVRAAGRALARGDLELAERQARAALNRSGEPDMRVRAEAESCLGGHRLPGRRR
nr:hypothetical protein GCM10010200_018860 [Actinomadura rugatobispora]